MYARWEESEKGQLGISGYGGGLGCCGCCGRGRLKWTIGIASQLADAGGSNRSPRPASLLSVWTDPKTDSLPRRARIPTASDSPEPMPPQNPPHRRIVVPHGCIHRSAVRFEQRSHDSRSDAATLKLWMDGKITNLARVLVQAGVATFRHDSPVMSSEAFDSTAANNVAVIEASCNPTCLIKPTSQKAHLDFTQASDQPLHRGKFFVGILARSAQQDS